MEISKTWVGRLENQHPYQDTKCLSPIESTIPHTQLTYCDAAATFENTLETYSYIHIYIG
jgi:hypothetical protein